MVRVTPAPQHNRRRSLANLRQRFAKLTVASITAAVIFPALVVPQDSGANQAVPWDPPESGNHSAACDSAITHRESVVAPPGTDLMLLVTVNASRFAATGGALHVALDGGPPANFPSTSLTPTTVTFQIPGASLAPGTQIDYSFTIRGVFADVSCASYAIARSPSRHGFHIAATAPADARNDDVWEATRLSILSAVDQPGVTATITRAALCDFFFIPPTPCDLYPQQSQTSEPPDPPVSVAPAEVWLRSDPAGFNTCVVQSGFFAQLAQDFEDPTLIDGVGQAYVRPKNLFVKSDGSADGRRGIYQESVVGAVGLEGGGRARATARSGFSVTYRSENPIGLVVLYGHVPSTLDGILQGDHSSLPAAPSGYDFEAKYRRTPQIYDVTLDAYESGVSDGESATPSSGARPVRKVTEEDDQHRILHAITMNQTYSYYTELFTEASAHTVFQGSTMAAANFFDFGSPQSAGERYWLQTDHVTLQLPDDSLISFDGRGCQP